MKVVSFKIEEYLLERLDRFCRATGMRRSEVLRLLIKKVVAEGKIELMNHSVRPSRPVIRVRKVVLD